MLFFRPDSFNINFSPPETPQEKSANYAKRQKSELDSRRQGTAAVKNRGPAMAFNNTQITYFNKRVDDETKQDAQNGGGGQIHRFFQRAGISRRIKKHFWFLL